MQSYIGTKVINARPMTRGEYNAFRGWSLPDGEKAADEGYLVEYTDGQGGNVAGFDGYVSWSPKDVLDKAYRQTSGLSFGLAIEALKAGRRVARVGWNGKGMWLALVLGHDYHPDTSRGAVHALGCQKLPWVGMKTADSKFVPWLASQTDMLADDWMLV